MKYAYQYIYFVERQTDDTRKTRLWSCMNTRHGHVLGDVRWDGSWRQYVFAPIGSTVFSGGCLADIQDFIKEAMAERKK